MPEYLNGTVVPAVDGFATHKIEGMPKIISTDVSRVEIEAISRTNGMTGHEDFVEEMASRDQRRNFIGRFPCRTNALNQRHDMAARLVIKRIPWGPTVSDTSSMQVARMIMDEMTDADKVANSTQNPKDFTQSDACKVHLHLSFLANERAGMKDMTWRRKSRR